MKKLILFVALIASACSPKIGTFSLRGEEVQVKGETLCVWYTYVFDKKADTLQYIRLDTLPCQVKYVTTFKME